MILLYPSLKRFAQKKPLNRLFLKRRTNSKLRKYFIFSIAVTTRVLSTTSEQGGLILPFTPFHFGVALFLYAVMPFLDPISLFIGAVIPDIEGIAALIIFPYSGLPFHGPLHSFLGALVLGVVVGSLSYLGLKLSQERGFVPSKMSITLRKSIISALLGTTSHIILDAPLYSDMNPFLPFTGNPLLGLVPYSTPYFVCTISFIVGLFIVLIRFRHHWRQLIDTTELRSLIKDQKVPLLVAIAVTISIIITLPFIVLFFSYPVYNPHEGFFEWTDECHGAVVFISLATDSPWRTNRSDKITFLFAVQNLNGGSNASVFYNNSYVILNRVRLDPSYINVSEAPSVQLSEKQAWGTDWYFTPRADDYALNNMGITKGMRINYSMLLEINYTVVDSKGVEWPDIFQDYLTISIIGGEDAP